MKQPLRILFSILSCITLTSPAWSQETPGGSSLGALNTKGFLGDTDTKDLGKLPTHITSDTLSLNAKTRVFTYQGNVKVTQGEMTLTSKTIDGSYNEQNQIQKIIARGDVVITKQDIKATSQLASYDAIAAVITLTDNPQLQQGESILIADKIKVFLNENRSQAEGNVRVTFVKSQTRAPEAAAPAATPTPAISPTPTPTPVATRAASPTPKSAKKTVGKAKRGKIKSQ